MGGCIYLVQQDGRLVEMTEQAYDSEDRLQELLAKYPNLLAGDQMDASKPRRWLLVCREADLPDEEGGGGRWSLDHLFLDQDAIPTLVEVKRSSDTRIRREVVGQMLDYAANAVAYWPVEMIQSRFEARCTAGGQSPEQVLAEFLGNDTTPDAFWQQAKTNLQAGRIRMVFVADEIPPELKRIVEFLNEQMDPAEVLAVEVRQYVGQNIQSLVPRVLGQTAEAQRKKSSGSRQTRQWDEPSFLQDLEAGQGSEAAAIARQVLDWARRRDVRIRWGQGGTDGSFYPVVEAEGAHYPLFSVWTYGRVEILFERLKRVPPFVDRARRLELRDRLNAIPGVSIPEDRIDVRPTFPLMTLREPATRERFLAVAEWIADEIRHEEQAGQ